MNDATGDGMPPVDPDGIDTGEPIRALTTLEEPTSDGFVDRVRHALDRRTLTSQVSSLWWDVPKVVLLEFLKLIFEWFGDPDRTEGDAR
jgi:hypothetical protein